MTLQQVCGFAGLACVHGFRSQARQQEQGVAVHAQICAQDFLILKQLQQAQVMPQLQQQTWHLSAHLLYGEILDGHAEQVVVRVAGGVLYAVLSRGPSQGLHTAPSYANSHVVQHRYCDLQHSVKPREAVDAARQRTFGE